MRKIFTIIICLSMIISCSDDETKRDLLQLEIHNQTNDLWLFATNHSGKLLDTKHWQGESALILRGNVKADERINIFLVSIEANKTNHVSAFKNVLPGRVWQVGKTLASPASSDNPIKVTVTNAPESGGAFSSFQGQHPIVFDFNCNTAECIFNMKPIPSLPGPILISYSARDADPVYYEAETVTPGTSLDLEFATAFKSFDQVISLPWSADGYVFSFTGGITDDGELILLAASDLSTVGEEIKLGLNEGYQKLYGVVTETSAIKDHSWSVFKPLITAADFEFPEDDFTVTDNSVSNFSFTNDWGKPIRSRKSQWHFRTTFNSEFREVYFELHGPGETGGVDLSGFPDELKEQYPHIDDPEYYNYSASNFTFNDDSQDGYDAYLENYFGEPVTYDLRTLYSVYK